MTRIPRRVLERLADEHCVADSESVDFDVERTIVGNGRVYDVLGELGRGGMAVVWLGLDRSVGRRVAIKEPKPILPRAAAARFNVEGWIQSQLEHPSVIPVFDFSGTHHQHAFMVMQHVNAPSWDCDRTWRRRRTREQNRSWTRVLIQVLSALSNAHESGVVHRDVKPSNILLRDDDNVYLSDWGVAYVSPDTPLFLAADASGAVPRTDWDADRDIERDPGVHGGGADGDTSAVGTPWYRAPEQVAGRIPSARADIFACGRILQRIWGVPERAVEGDTRYARGMERMPRPIADVARVATADDPEDRYESAAAMSDDLQAYLDGEMISLDRHKPIEHARHFLVTHKLLVGMALMFLCGAVYMDALRSDAQAAERVATHDLLEAGQRNEQAEARRLEAQATLDEIGRVITGAAYRFGSLRGADMMDRVAAAVQNVQDGGDLRAQAVEECCIALVEQGRRAEAAEKLAGVLDYRRRAADERSTVDNVRKLAATTIRWGDLHDGRDRWSLFLDAHRLLEDLAARAPDHRGVRDDLVWSHIRQSNPVHWDGGGGRRWSTQGRALWHLEEADRIATELWTEEPTDLRSLHGLATVCLRRSRVADGDMCTELVDRALRFATAMWANPNANLVQMAVYVTALRTKASQIVEASGVDAALPVYEAELAAVRRIAVRDGGARHYASLGSCAIRLARLLRGREPERAALLVEEALGAADEIRSRDPENRAVTDLVRRAQRLENGR